MDLCSRCAKLVDATELCWSGEAALCFDCWERFGVCLASDCVRNQMDLARATTPEERNAITARPGPIGATRRREH